MGYSVTSWLSANFRVVARNVVVYSASDQPSVPYDKPCFSVLLQNSLDALHLHETSVAFHFQDEAIALQFPLKNPELGMGWCWLILRDWGEFL